jgi:hypothetical protein
MNTGELNARLLDDAKELLCSDDVARECEGKSKAQISGVMGRQLAVIAERNGKYALEVFVRQIAAEEVEKRLIF